MQVTRRRLLGEWLALLCVLSAVAVWMASGTSNYGIGGRLEDPDQFAYDTLQRFAPIAPSPDLVLIEIDDDSVAQIGRWPWKRAVQAALVDRLRVAGVRVVALDLLLSEEGAGDRLLGASLSALAPNARAVLPVTLQIDAAALSWPVYPLPDFGHQVALGHAHFAIDRDGLVRSVFLAEAGLPAFSLAALKARLELSDVATPGALQGLPELATQALRVTGPAFGDRALAGGSWPRTQRLLMSRLEALPPRVSAGALLRGDVAPELLRGRVALIGVTAAGLGDRHSSAAMTDGYQLVPGLHLHAAVYSAMQAGRPIQRGSPWLHGVSIVLALCAAMILLYQLKPVAGALLVGLLMLGVLGLSVLALRRGMWYPPSGLLLSLSLAVPLWSWRRLAIAVSHLRSQSRSLGNVPAWVSFDTMPPDAAREPVMRDLLQLEQSANRLLGLHSLLAGVMDGLPNPAIVAAEEGLVVYRNKPWRDKWGTWPATIGESPGGGSQPFGWAAPACPLGRSEVRDQEGTDWLIDCAEVAIGDDGPQRRLRLIQFVDISALRNAERERDQMVRFLSHDLRSPHVAITSLAERLIEQQGHVPELDGIARHARYALSVAGGFVHLSRAELRPLRADPLELVELAQQVVDLAWTSERGPRLSLQFDPSLEVDGAPLIGDAELLRRAMLNLVENAFTHGPPDGAVVLRVDPGSPGRWRVAVADQGPNMDAATRERLFEPFWRQSGDSVGGAGLGLAFVRVVAIRHGGAPICEPISPTGNLIGLEVDATRQEAPAVGLALGAHPPADRGLLERRGADRRARERRTAQRRAAERRTAGVDKSAEADEGDQTPPGA
ncbi:MAG: CHASE2 domain-containing protein [Burkholderiaceae bacterium]|nr:CHASE2 domain-containing protein [Burkholderiaceae bacterium]